MCTVSPHSFSPLPAPCWPVSWPVCWQAATGLTNARKQRQLERSLEQLSQQQREYRQAVVRHFTDTATQLNKLAESYRDVHNQLAAGARALADSHSAALLQPLPDGESTDADNLSTLSNVQQPLDYAPKEFSPREGDVERRVRAEQDCLK